MAWSPLVELVTLDQVKQRLKLPLDTTAEDDDLNLHLLIAHEEVMDYVTQRLVVEDDEDSEAEHDEWIETVDGWTAETAPKRVLGAILAQSVYRYRYRGDDEKAPSREQGQTLCREAENLLYRLRDPGVG